MLAMSLLLLLLLSTVAWSNGYDHNVNYWEAFAPGKLLQRLDTLTNAASGERTLPSASGNGTQRKVDAAAELAANADDADGDDDEAEELSSHSADVSDDDYERNYEQFVRQYFERAPSSAEYDELDASLHSGSLEASEDYDYEPAPHASSVQKQRQKDGAQQRCKRIRRNGQLCRICRQARNNEVSETCSYTHEAEPQQYVYGNGTQYKRYRDSPADSGEQQSRRRRAKSPGADEASGGSLCVRRLLKQRVCYDCKDSAGHRLRRCYNAPAQMEQPHSAAQEQRIYKRTVSYAYEQATGPNEANGTARPDMLHAAARHVFVLPSRRQRRRTVVKVVRRRG